MRSLSAVESRLVAVSIERLEAQERAEMLDDDCHYQLGVVIADRVWAALGVGDVEVSSQA